MNRFHVAWQHPAVFALPAVKRLLRYFELSAYFRYWRAQNRLFQRKSNLRLCVITLLNFIHICLFISLSFALFFGGQLF